MLSLVLLCLKSENINYPKFTCIHNSICEVIVFVCVFAAVSSETSDGKYWHVYI